MQLSGQIRVLIAAYPQKDPRYLLRMKLGGLQCIFRCCERTEKSVARTGIRTPDRSPYSLVTILTELRRINIHHIRTFSGVKSLGFAWNYYWRYFWDTRYCLPDAPFKRLWRQSNMAAAAALLSDKVLYFYTPVPRLPAWLAVKPGRYF